MHEALRYVEADTLKWFIVRVPPGKELTATRVLEAHGMLVTYPTHRMQRKASRHVSRMVDMGERPSLSGYVFIAFAPSIDDDDIPWFQVRKVHLVNSIVGDGERKPLRVPYGGAHGMWRLFAPAVFLTMQVTQQARIYRRDRVKVSDGPFAKFEGFVEDIGEGDAKVLLELFGRKVPVTLGLGQLEKAA